VIVVEHDEDAIRRRRLVVDIGPGAGVHGGQSSPGHARRHHGEPGVLTGQYLSGERGADAAAAPPPATARSCASSARAATT
jgi:excinuclease UvrABC ATPase subunit